MKYGGTEEMKEGTCQHDNNILKTGIDPTYNVKFCVDTKGRGSRAPRILNNGITYILSSVSHPDPLIPKESAVEG
jgi:hypothetical protein